MGKPLSPEIKIVPLGLESENIVVNFSLSGKSGEDIILTPENNDYCKSMNSSNVESDTDFYSDPETSNKPTNRQNNDKRVCSSDSEIEAKKLKSSSSLTQSGLYKNVNPKVSTSKSNR